MDWDLLNTGVVPQIPGPHAAVVTYGNELPLQRDHANGGDSISVAYHGLYNFAGIDVKKANELILVSRYQLVAVFGQNDFVDLVEPVLALVFEHAGNSSVFFVENDNALRRAVATGNFVIFELHNRSRDGQRVVVHRLICERAHYLYVSLVFNRLPELHCAVC